MAKTQGQRSSKKHVRLRVAILLALCALGVFAAIASATESPPTPEAAPPSAAPAGPESPAPEPAPAASRPSPAPADPSHNATPASALASPPSQSAPRRQPAPRTRSERGARARHGVSGRRRVHADPSAGTRSVARARGGPAIVARPTASPLSSHRDGALLLLASLALGALALAGLMLLRLLTRLERLSHGSLA
jgi:hypothetical protein